MQPPIGSFADVVGDAMLVRTILGLVAFSFMAAAVRTVFQESKRSIGAFLRAFVLAIASAILTTLFIHDLQWTPAKQAGAVFAMGLAGEDVIRLLFRVTAAIGNDPRIVVDVLLRKIGHPGLGALPPKDDQPPSQ